MPIDISNSNRFLFASTFRNMIRRYNEYVQRYEKEPSCVYVDRRRRAYVTLDRFKEMLERWNTFKEEEDREPYRISIQPPIPLKIAYYLRAKDVPAFDPGLAAAKKCTDVFLSSKSLEKPAMAENFIRACHDKSISVHAWIQCLFKDKTTYTPGNRKNQSRIKKEIKQAVKLGLDGVHLDYLCYFGKAPRSGVDRITNLAMKLRDYTKRLKSKTFVSATVMPELAANPKYYGQSYKRLAPYVDFLVPMAYKGNYDAPRAWIVTVTQYVLQRAWNKVWTALQSYRSDDDLTPLPRSELEKDIKAAHDAGAQKAVIFRFGLSKL